MCSSPLGAVRFGLGVLMRDVEAFLRNRRKLDPDADAPSRDLRLRRGRAAVG